MRNNGIYDRLDQQRVVFGRPYAAQVAEEAARLDANRVFVVCSASLDAKLGVLDALSAALGPRFAGGHTKMSAHTPRSDVLAASAAAREAGADLLVGVGGGSVIDGVKAMQLALSEGVRNEADLAGFARSLAQSPDRIAGPACVRQIAVPTTLSGAEFGTNAGVTDTAAGLKEGYNAPQGAPLVVIFDPDLARHTPDRLWLGSAVRSIDHACEGLCASDTFPYLDQQFLGALRLLNASLPRTRKAPDDVEARSLSQQGVWVVSAGIGQVKNGASHGLGYILGAMGVAHGETSCVLLPAVLAWNAPLNADRQAMISEALGRPDTPAANAVRDLVAGLGLPTRLADVGIPEDRFDRIAEVGVRHPTVLANPRPITTREDILEILELAR